MRLYNALVFPIMDFGAPVIASFLEEFSKEFEKHRDVQCSRHLDV